MTNFLSNLLNKTADRVEGKIHKQADRARSPQPPKDKPADHGHHSMNQPPHGVQPPAIPTNKPQAHDTRNQQAGGRRAYWQPGLVPAIPLESVFRHETGAHGWGNNEAQNYTSSATNSFFGDDALHVRAVAQSTHADAAARYTSARLTSHQTLGRDRGALTARITAPVAKGVWPAFWLLPADPFSWPGDGEVDVFEAWDGSALNHSCLHWGQFDGRDWDKHRVVETELGARILGGPVGSGRGHGEGVLFELVWSDAPGGRGPRMLVWYVDGRPVMKATMPAGTRPLRDFRLIINVALGGNVCKSRLPDDGVYEMVVRDLAMWEEPSGGWDKFEKHWRETKEGHP